MRIATSSASASVTRTLESLIALSGHHLAKNIADADLVLNDRLHATKTTLAHDVACLNLVAKEDTAEHALVCPIRPERLLMRLVMLNNTQTNPLSNGWALDMQARQLQHTDARTVALTEKECALLRHLHAAHPSTLSREDLLEQVWGMAGDVDSHTLETHIYRLRSKLSEITPSPADILSENGRYGLALHA